MAYSSTNGPPVLDHDESSKWLTGQSVAAIELKTLFARDTDCLDCPPDQPSCPSCPGGEVCSLIPQSCKQCAHMECVPNGITTGTGKQSGPNVGAIAGGVVGGVAFVVIVTVLLWWFWIRPRRQDQDYQDEWEDDEYAARKSQFQEQRDDRRSVHSVASTVLSRASNMIPIAFIPGVTNRDGTMPPVPPIPAARNYAPSPLSSGSNNGAIFFSAGDLRNSAYSDSSSINNRDTFIGRPSISASLARESVASDVYHDTAQENPMPAQTIQRAKPTMVSLKSTANSTKSSPLGTTISTPNEFSESGPRSNQPAVVIPGSASTSVYSGGASFVKPTPVTISKKSSLGRFPVRTPSGSNTLRGKPAVPSPLAVGKDADTTDDEDDEPHSRARQSLLNTNRESSTTIQDTPRSQGSPFVDAQAPHTQGLTSVIEESMRRASSVPKHTGLGGRTQRDQGPFSDEHASGED